MLPTIAGLVHYQVERAIKETHALAASTATTLAALPAPVPPLTLDQIRAALSATGSTPLNVFQLLGTAGLGTLQYGTHNERLATLPSAAGNGALFWETDRTALYAVINNAWAFLYNQPFFGTLEPDEKPTDLGPEDPTFQFFSTDFDRLYYWTGTLWRDGFGQPTRGAVVAYDDDLNANLAPGVGWQLMDGTANVRGSASDGSTYLFNVPDMDGLFIHGTTGATGATGGDATNHTHDVDVLDTVTRTVAVGAENTAGSQTRTTTGPSGAGGDDALPPYRKLRWYIRL